MAVIGGGCPDCGNIGCTMCGKPAVVNEAAVKESVAIMAAESTRLAALKPMVTGVSRARFGEYFVPDIIARGPPLEMPLDG